MKKRRAQVYCETSMTSDANVRTWNNQSNGKLDLFCSCGDVTRAELYYAIMIIVDRHFFKNEKMERIFLYPPL